MSKKDVLTALYLKDKNRFADLINVHCFGGKTVIHPEDIQEADSTEIYVQKEEASIHTRKKYRDLTRKVACGTQFVIISIEDQSHVDYAMPFRVMSYDAGRYEQQLLERKQEHRKRKDLSPGAEFLSGISQTDRFLPVITIVLFFGKHWDGPRSLHELLEMRHLPPELRDLVADYPLYLIEVGNYPYAERFKTDLRLVFGFLQNVDNKEKLRAFAQKERSGLAALPEDAYDLITALSDSKELSQLKEDSHPRKETVNMFKALEEMIQDAKAEGRDEFLKELIQKKLAQKISIPSIAQLLEVDEETVLRLAKEINDTPVRL